MRYLHFAFPIVALSAVHVAAVAGAQSEGRGDFVRHIFTSADTDGDGELTFAEFKAHVVAHTTHPNRPANAPPPPTDEQIADHFTSIDTDESGALSFEEFQAGHRPPPPPRDR